MTRHGGQTVCGCRQRFVLRGGGVYVLDGNTTSLVGVEVVPVNPDWRSAK